MKIKNLKKKYFYHINQIAFGITDYYANTDFPRMMQYARDKGIIPNYTTHGLDIDDAAAQFTAEVCGAVAVSTVKIEKTFEAIDRFAKAGMKQINIHYMLSEETYDNAFNVIDKAKENGNVNAIVFLLYKPKGRNPESFSSISSVDKYKKLIQYCEEKKIGCGFDSCSAPMYFKAVEGNSKEKQLTMFAEPCESGLFSSYINCEGKFYLCSFSEDVLEGINVLKVKSFLRDVWNSNTLEKQRRAVINSSKNCKCKFVKICRKCICYEEITPCARV
jgi:hypothetical protein